MRGWDFVEEIGVPGRTVNVPVLRRVPHIKSSAAFWDIPLDVIPFVAPLPTVVQDVTCPPVRYQSEKAPPRTTPKRKPLTNEPSSDENVQDDPFQKKKREKFI
jgi:hypothetical protein